LGNWSASKKGTRRGPKVRFPRFKGKRRAMSCRFTTGAFGLADTDRRHVKLPRIAPGPHPRVDPETRPAYRPRHRPHPLGDGVAPGRTLVLLVLRAGRTPRPGPGPPGVGGGGRPRRHVPGGAVHRGGHRQPAPPRGRPTGVAPVAAPSLQACRPRQAHPRGPLAAVAHDPGPHRETAHRCRRRPPRRVAQAVHPARPRARHHRDPRT
jgi:hypothetical protein